MSKEWLYREAYDTYKYENARPIILYKKMSREWFFRGVVAVFFEYCVGICLCANKHLSRVTWPEILLNRLHDVIPRLKRHQQTSNSKGWWLACHSKKEEHHHRKGKGITNHNRRTTMVGVHPYGWEGTTGLGSTLPRLVCVVRHAV